jgi:hypothetical protein
VIPTKARDARIAVRVPAHSAGKDDLRAHPRGSDRLIISLSSRLHKEAFSVERFTGFMKVVNTEEKRFSAKTNESYFRFIVHFELQKLYFGKKSAILVKVSTGQIKLFQRTLE